MRGGRKVASKTPLREFEMTTHSLKNAHENRSATIYYGHLLVDAERAMAGSATPEETLSLSWLTGELISRGGPRHYVNIQGINFAGIDLGDWSLTMSISTVPKTPIEIFRQNLLAREGRESCTLAAPLLRSNEPQKFEAFCLTQIAYYCYKQDLKHAVFLVRDCEGHQTKISVKRLSKPFFKTRLKTLAGKIPKNLTPSRSR